jgi:chromosome segregation ATPase
MNITDFSMIPINPEWPVWVVLTVLTLLAVIGLFGVWRVALQAVNMSKRTQQSVEIQHAQTTHAATEAMSKLAQQTLSTFGTISEALNRLATATDNMAKRNTDDQKNLVDTVTTTHAALVLKLETALTPIPKQLDAQGKIMNAVQDDTTSLKAQFEHLQQTVTELVTMLTPLLKSVPQLDQKLTALQVDVQTILTTSTHKQEQAS